MKIEQANAVPARVAFRTLAPGATFAWVGYLYLVAQVRVNKAGTVLLPGTPAVGSRTQKFGVRLDTGLGEPFDPETPVTPAAVVARVQDPEGDAGG